MAICIACAEEIKNEAKLCKHCGTVQSDPRFREDSREPNAPNLYAAWWIQLLFLSLVLIDPSTGFINSQNSIRSFIPDLAFVVFAGNGILALIMLFVYVIRKARVPNTSSFEWLQSFLIFAGAGLYTVFLGIVFLMP